MIQTVGSAAVGTPQGCSRKAQGASPGMSGIRAGSALLRNLNWQVAQMLSFLNSIGEKNNGVPIQVPFPLGTPQAGLVLKGRSRSDPNCILRRHQDRRVRCRAHFRRSAVPPLQGWRSTYFVSQGLRPGLSCVAPRGLPLSESQMKAAKCATPPARKHLACIIGIGSA